MATAYVATYRAIAFSYMKESLAFSYMEFGAVSHLTDPKIKLLTTVCYNYLLLNIYNRV